MKTEKKCPRCETPMDWQERASVNLINIGTFECWKCQKIIAGHQMPGQEPEETK
jgi:phage FluMu protein Com